MDREQFELHAHMEDRHWWFLGRRRILLAIASELLPEGVDCSVVDLGCGTGGNTAALALRFRAVGIDHNAGAIELARARFPEIEFTVASAADDDIRNLLHGADLVISSDVMEHVEDDRAFLHGILASLDPDARLLLTVPAHPDLWSPHDVALGHYRRYTPETLRALWSDEPVRAELVTFFNARLFLLARLERMLTRRRGETRGEHHTDLSLPPPPINRALARVFAGEVGRLVSALRGEARPFANGLSLMAVLRRLPPPPVTSVAS